MKKYLSIIIFLNFVLFSIGQSYDSALFFKRHDTLFLKRTQAPFNGELPKQTEYKYYLDGVVTDSLSLQSDIWFYLAYLIIPSDNDTFLIDYRYKINKDIFNRGKIFFLKTMERHQKSRFINIDTLNSVAYSEIKIPDEGYYNYYEQAKTCPIGNHKNNLVEYLWGLPTKKGFRMARKK